MLIILIQNFNFKTKFKSNLKKVVHCDTKSRTKISTKRLCSIMNFKEQKKWSRCIGCESNGIQNGSASLLVGNLFLYYIR